jgi:hypothetical protein
VDETCQAQMKNGGRCDSCELEVRLGQYLIRSLAWALCWFRFQNLAVVTAEREMMKLEVGRESR